MEREPSLVAFARKHLPKNVRVEEAEIEAYLRNAAAKGKKADFIFMDLDKPMYASCYEIIMQEGLLAPGGLLLCDNVLYRGLTAQHRAGEMPNVSEKVASNAASLRPCMSVCMAFANCSWRVAMRSLTKSCHPRNARSSSRWWSRRAACSSKAVRRSCRSARERSRDTGRSTGGSFDWLVRRVTTPISARRCRSKTFVFPPRTRSAEAPGRSVFG